MFLFEHLTSRRSVLTQQVEHGAAEVRGQAHGGFAMDADDLKSASSAYPDKKAKGIDAWEVAILAVLPHIILQSFAAVLNAAASALMWPCQLLLNLMALIPKQTGGRRPVAKTPMLYRLFCIVRQPLVKEWAIANSFEWDFATAGKSALYSAAMRCWTNEMAILSGRHTSSLLWDIKQFFDNISPEMVLAEGIRMGYPLLDLIMGLQMHMAPRLLIVSGVASSLVLPLLSILAGCLHSVNFAKILMHTPISRAVKDGNGARTTTFVDDVAQVAIGSYKSVLQSIVDAGLAFCYGMRSIKLTISPKSVVVSSSPKMSRTISQLINRHARVSIAVKSHARDLGVLNNPTGKRVTGLQKDRLAKAKKRLTKVSKLAKSVRKASVLAYTGALPQALWGSVSLGLAPSALKSLVARTAAATGISAAGRCPATAIALAMGQDRHPVVQTAVEQVSLWIDLWRGEASLRALAARFWRVAHDRVIQYSDGQALPNVQWQRVIGPFSATLAKLTEQGWRLDNPCRWVDPSGFAWEPDFDADKAPFLSLVARYALKVVWQAASEGWCGQGLQDGVDWVATLSLLQHINLVNSGDALDLFLNIDIDRGHDVDPEVWHDKARVWLELLLCGGFWPEERAAGIHGTSYICPRCKRSPESALHLLWTCPANAYIPDRRVQSTQPLVQDAIRGSQAYPCLWLRGLLPTSLVTVNTPFQDELHLNYVGRVMEHDWPPGCYFTDASGGRFSAMPILRRCGFGIAYMHQTVSDFRRTSDFSEQPFFRWGAFGVQVGSVHTVPRSELFAILVVVQKVPSGKLVICTDSKINVDLYIKGFEACKSSTNSDLWIQIWQKLHQGHLSLTLRWVKGHVSSPDDMVKYNLQPFELYGNLAADALANKGSQLAEVWTHDSANVLAQYALVRQIQARALVILTSVMHTRLSQQQHKGQNKVKLLKCKPIPISGAAIGSTHQFTMMASTLRCCLCLEHCPSHPVAAARWMRGPCVPNVELLSSVAKGECRPTAVPRGAVVHVGRRVIHHSHDLANFKGLYFCRSCGYFASVKAQHLYRECTRSSKAAQRRVAALKQGKLPSGLASFPNDVERASETVVQLDQDAALLRRYLEE